MNKAQLRAKRRRREFRRNMIAKLGRAAYATWLEFNTPGRKRQ